MILEITKICNKCKQEKFISLFYKNKNTKDGINYVCKECSSLYEKEHDGNGKRRQRRKNNIEKFRERDKIHRNKNREKYREANRKWALANKEDIEHYNKNYYELNKDKFSEKSKIYYQNNKEYIKSRVIKYNNSHKGERQKYNFDNKEHISQRVKEYYQLNRILFNKKSRERSKRDPNFRISRLLRCRMYLALKGIKKWKRSEELLGCNIKEWKNYLESLFLPEMNWDNHGLFWEIDHIKPCAKFDLLDPEQQKSCFNFLNTQPLFITTEIAESLGYINYVGNRNKGDKY